MTAHGGRPPIGKALSVRLSDATRAELERRAVEWHMSMAQVARELIEDGLRQSLLREPIEP